MDYVSQIAQYVVSGVTLGSIYILIALGFTVIHNTTGVLNFAQGEFVVIGGFGLVLFCTQLGFPVPIGFALTIPLVFIIGVIIDRLVMYPLRHSTLLIMVIITIAVSSTMSGSALLIFGKESHSFPTFSERGSLELLGAFISPQVLWILGFLAIVSIILWYFFNKTIYGKAMMACSEDRIAARAMGINPDLMSSLSWGISGALGASAGALVIPITLMEFGAGGTFLIKGIAAMLVGGMGSYMGAVAGGLLVGLLESMGAGLVSPINKDIFSMLCIFFVLMFKPTGLFGKRKE
jgi:branched-chain amino acid transport system permease protein